jgi:hypothetical protein
MTDEKTDGDFTLTAGKWYGDAEADQGIQTGPDARFFASYSELSAAFSNEGKDLVVQVRGPHPNSRCQLSDPELCAEHARMLSIIRDEPPQGHLSS